MPRFWDYVLFLVRGIVTSGLLLSAVPPYWEGADLVTQVPQAVRAYGQVKCARNLCADSLEVRRVVVLLIASLVPAAWILALWAVGPVASGVLIHVRLVPAHEY